MYDIILSVSSSLLWFNNTVAWSFLSTTTLGNFTAFSLICLGSYAYGFIFNDKKDMNKKKTIGLQTIEAIAGPITAITIIYNVFFHILPSLIFNFNIVYLALAYIFTPVAIQ